MYDECVMLTMRFPQKLWKIVSDCKTGAIMWSANGGTILLDYKKFHEEYLSAKNPLFKTSNITSFIRQLNLYGFRKVTSHNRDPVCNSTNPDVHEFLHENFRFGRSDLLVNVCRKSGSNNNKRKTYERANCVNPINVNATKKYEPPEVKPREMTRLQLCQFALTKALEQATRDYHREKMVGQVLKNEALMELDNLENEGNLAKIFHPTDVFGKTTESYELRNCETSSETEFVAPSVCPKNQPLRIILIPTE